MSLSDEELAQRAKQGDREAFATLISAHQRRTYGLALQLLKNSEDAADATQEAFARCYTSLNSFDAQRSFGAWLYRIAYNHCLDVLRRRKHVAVGSRDALEGELAEEIPDPGPGVEDLVERAASSEAVSQALDHLAEDHRRVLVLRYTLDLPYQEIAHVLGVPESTVTMRLHHARKAIRQNLAGFWEAENEPS